MPCVWLFAAVVLGEYEKDTVNAAAVSRPADWIEGGVPTSTPRTKTTKSPTVKRARRRMIRPAVCPVFELYAEVRRADNDTGPYSRIFNPTVRDERFTEAECSGWSGTDCRDRTFPSAPRAVRTWRHTPPAHGPRLRPLPPACSSHRRLAGRMGATP